MTDAVVVIARHATLHKIVVLPQPEPGLVYVLFVRKHEELHAF
jgi:hypothetical protein